MEALESRWLPSRTAGIAELQAPQAPQAQQAPQAPQATNKAPQAMPCVASGWDQKKVTDEALRVVQSKTDDWEAPVWARRAIPAGATPATACNLSDEQQSAMPTRMPLAGQLSSCGRSISFSELPPSRAPITEAEQIEALKAELMKLRGEHLLLKERVQVTMDHPGEVAVRTVRRGEPQPQHVASSAMLASSPPFTYPSGSPEIESAQHIRSILNFRDYLKSPRKNLHQRESFSAP